MLSSLFKVHNNSECVIQNDSYCGRFNNRYKRRINYILMTTDYNFMILEILQWWMVSGNLRTISSPSICLTKLTENFNNVVKTNILLNLSKFNLILFSISITS